MDEYKAYLANKIISEEQVVTYRYLSRALKVHVNEAKQMLFEFHRSQNARQHGSIHATYLLYGVKKPDESASQAQDDGDIEMTSSMPEIESNAVQVPIYTMSLVKEEDLNDVVSQYDKVSLVHVYSIGPHPMKDLQLLANTARQVLELSAGDDNVTSLKTYGTITNSHVQRRDRRSGAIPQSAPAAPASAAAKKAEAKPTAASTAKPTASAAPVKQERATAEAKPADVKDAPSIFPAKKPTPSLKRNASSGASSGIMQAFAKGAASAKPKKKEPAAPANEEHMALSDDGEDDSEVIPQPKAPMDNRRKKREDDLRQMMEEDDEEEADEPEEREDTPMEEAEPVVEEFAPPEPAKQEPAEEVTASTGDGRRRGRKRVMKKKQIMDDEGFLVTIQEQGWESFSEDEPAPAPKAKPAASASTAASSGAAAAKPKKAAQKGQGNIMSFFSKK